MCLLWTELSGLTPESVAELEGLRRKELRKMRDQREAAQNLVGYLDACHVEALVKVARNSLDALKTRISTNAVIGSCKLLAIS